MTTELGPHFQSLDNAQEFGLANYSGVYFFCQGATVVYVGRAKNVRQRVVQQAHLKDFGTVLVMRVPERLLDSVEMYWIKKLCPKLNICSGQSSFENRGCMTFRMDPALITGVKRAAKRKNISQADYIDAVVRPALIADGAIKP